MVQYFRLHADSRHGQSKGRAGARRRRCDDTRTCASQSDASGREHERGQYQAQTRPGFAFGKIGPAADRAGPQASAQNYLLNKDHLLVRFEAAPADVASARVRILTPMRGPRKATA